MQPILEFFINTINKPTNTNNINNKNKNINNTDN